MAKIGRYLESETLHTSIYLVSKFSLNSTSALILEIIWVTPVKKSFCVEIGITLANIFWSS